MKLTKTLLDTLKFIQRFSQTNQYRPALGDIMAEFNISKSAAFSRIDRLRKMGYLETLPQHARTMRPTDEGIEAIALSFLTIQQRQWPRENAAWWRDALDRARHGNYELGG